MKVTWKTRKQLTGNTKRIIKYPILNKDIKSMIRKYNIYKEKISIVVTTKNNMSVKLKIYQNSKKEKINI